MKCQVVQQALSAYMDGQLAKPMRRRMSEHLAHCGDCFAISEQQVRIKISLGRLPVRVPPASAFNALPTSCLRLDSVTSTGNVGYSGET